MDSSFFIYMFTLGLGTSLHCVSMCGPLVLTYAVKGAEGGPWYRKLTPNLAYQGAKLTSYMLVGVLLGSLGSVFNIDALRPYIMFLAGAFMIVLGLGMTGKVAWASKLTPRPPKWLMTAIMRLRKKSVADAQAGEGGLTTPVFFGLMTGLMPCGPLMAAQVSAAASGSAASGAIGMAAFAAGTAPLMLVFGTAGSLVPVRWKNRLMSVLAVGVMVFGLVFINRGLMLTGSPVNFNTVKGQFVSTQAPDVSNAEYKTGEDGVIEIPLVIQNTQFQPASVKFPSDKPVRLIVDRREDFSCSDQLAIPQAGVLVDLAGNGITKVDVPPLKTGTYTLTCGMGMMSGQIVVGGAVAYAKRPLPWLLLALVASAGTLHHLRRRDALRSTAKDAARKAANAKKGSKTGKGQGSTSPAPAPSTAHGVLGLSPQQVIIVGGSIAFAVLLGLMAGGMFR